MEERVVGERLVRIAMQAAKLLWIELFIPGGTLLVLAILLTGSATPLIPRKLASLMPFRIGGGRTVRGENVSPEDGLCRTHGAA
jgi:hypothetical protein